MFSSVVEKLAKRNKSHRNLFIWVSITVLIGKNRARTSPSRDEICFRLLVLADARSLNRYDIPTRMQTPVDVCPKLTSIRR